MQFAAGKITSVFLAYPMQPGNLEIRRYARHLALAEVGYAGQMKLQAASVLVIGAGGLGSPVALYLAAAGVGRIGIADHDAVELSNLQRQILHGTPDVGRPKTQSARETLHAVFSRAYSGMKGRTIIVNFPGSLRGAELCATLMAGIMRHGRDMVLGGDHGKPGA